MAAIKKNYKICSNGHSYKKSIGCPTCPVCESLNKPASGFLSLLSAPARRALENKGITTLQQLAAHSEKDILQLHGMGKASLPILHKVLKAAYLNFKK